MARHFLALHDYNELELDEHADPGAGNSRRNRKQGIPTGFSTGKTLAMIFEKSSTRTRISFEVGMFQLGGHGLFISSKTPRWGAASRSRTPPGSCPATATA